MSKLVRFCAGAALLTADFWGAIGDGLDMAADITEHWEHRESEAAS